MQSFISTKELTKISRFGVISHVRKEFSKLSLVFWEPRWMDVLGFSMYTVFTETFSVLFSVFTLSTILANHSRGDDLAVLCEGGFGT